MKMDAATILARKLRLTFVQLAKNQGMITADDARELLSGPLSPDDPSTQCDDSALLDDELALEKIKAQKDDTK